MASKIDPSSVPLTALSYKSRNLLSCLLNSKKVLPSDGPEKLPRDWRGLACLLNVSTEVAAGIENVQDKTSEILAIWSQKRDGTATIGQLFQFLQRIDRYDVYDDLQELLHKGELADSRPTTETSQNRQISRLEDVRDDLITFDDVKYGEPQLYHAYVLFAREDKEFIDELLHRMKEQGFKLCTEDDLLPGHSTQYAPVSQLISERCHRIILVYSPDFLNSPANTFYMNYAQAVGIETKKPKIIPCMYRHCQLPSNLSYYHKLYYTPPGQKAAYDFWHKLSQSLELANLPRLTSGVQSTQHSSISITELKPISNGYRNTGSYITSQTNFLALPAPAPAHSASCTSLETLQVTSLPDDTRSLGDLSQVTAHTKTKKVSKLRKIYNSITGKKFKNKKAIMIEN